MKSENSLTFIQIRSEIGALFVRKTSNFCIINIQIIAVFYINIVSLVYNKGVDTNVNIIQMEFK